MTTRSRTMSARTHTPCCTSLYTYEKRLTPSLPPITPSRRITPLHQPPLHIQPYRPPHTLRHIHPPSSPDHMATQQRTHPPRALTHHTEEAANENKATKPEPNPLTSLCFLITFPWQPAERKRGGGEVGGKEPVEVEWKGR